MARSDGQHYRGLVRAPRPLGRWRHSGDDDIVSRLVDLDGNALGSELQVSAGGGSKDFPAVAHAGQTLNLANRVSLVVWVDDRDGGRDIWAQVLGSSGAATQGSNVKVSGTDEDFFPAVEYGATGSNNGVFLGAWTQESSEGESEVYGRLVQEPGGTTGTTVGSTLQISSPSGSTGGGAIGPDIAYDDVNDEFLVVWGDERGNAAEQRDLWGQRVDTSGNLQGSNVQVTDEPGFERGPEIVYHGEEQEHFVVWEGRPDGDFSGATNARAQRLDADGNPVGPDGRWRADPETTGIDFNSGFEAVKRNNFDARRQPVFRYALRKHAGSGRGEIWGNDFWWRYGRRSRRRRFRRPGPCSAALDVRL